MLHLKQTFSRKIISDVVSDESVYPWITDDNSPEDPEYFVDSLLANQDNLFIKVVDNDNQVGGLFVARKVSNFSYEIHTNLLPHCRGELAIEAGQKVLEWLFTKTDCMRVVSVIPDNNPAAKHLAESCGMELQYSRKYAFKKDGNEYGLKYYHMTIYDYIWGNEKEYLPYGETFHEQVDRVHLSQGTDSHPEDVAHNVMAGFCYFTVLNGDYLKAFMLYNEWAKVSGYQPLKYLVKTHDNDFLLSQQGLNIVISQEGIISPMEEE